MDDLIKFNVKILARVEHSWYLKFFDVVLYYPLRNETRKIDVQKYGYSNFISKNMDENKW